MSNTSRVDKKLFDKDHYLGKPADDEDRIIGRRIRILEKYPEFFDREKTLIEIGCGSGATINQIAHRFGSATGVDIFDYSATFEKNRQKYGAGNSRFVQLDLEKTVLPGKFDRLISFEVIEHLRSEESISAYYDLLRDGGMAAISVPNKWWIFETHGARLPLLPWNRVPFFSWLPTRIHERYANARIYTIGRISKLLESQGFTIVDSSYITAPMDVVKNRTIKNMLTKSIFRDDTTSSPFLSTSIFVLAQKNTTR
jgi:2-polyprenyl-3-methyl-5-hydroxy-6-metoxy-1,4-benzoquinol methylase